MISDFFKAFFDFESSKLSLDELKKMIHDEVTLSQSENATSRTGAGNSETPFYNRFIDHGIPRHRRRRRLMLLSISCAHSHHFYIFSPGGCGESDPLGRAAGADEQRDSETSETLSGKMPPRGAATAALGHGVGFDSRARSLPERIKCTDSSLA